MNWQDADAKSRAAWFAFHGWMIADARDRFRVFAEEYAKTLADCGATEHALSAEDILARGLESFDAILAEEVRRDLGV